MFKHLLLIGAGLALGYLAMVLNLTSPDKVSPLMLLTVFLAIFIVVWQIVFSLISLIKRSQEVVYKDLVLKKQLPLSNTRKNYIYAATLAGALVVLLAMQSIEPLKLYEFGLVVLSSALIIFYVHKKS